MNKVGIAVEIFFNLASLAFLIYFGYIMVVNGYTMGLIIVCTIFILYFVCLFYISIFDKLKAIEEKLNK